MSEDIVGKFWSRVDTSNRDGCWEWRGAIVKLADGRVGAYGHLWAGGKHVKAHRFAWTLENGNIPPGMHVCHRCDNPTCVRPDHLFLGTHTDNMRDMVRKGRAGRRLIGPNNLNSKLCTNDVRVIRGMLHSGETKAAIARRFRVTRRCVAMIADGLTWRHVA